MKVVLDFSFDLTDDNSTITKIRLDFQHSMFDRRFVCLHSIEHVGLEIAEARCRNRDCAVNYP